MDSAATQTKKFLGSSEIHNSLVSLAEDPLKDLRDLQRKLMAAGSEVIDLSMINPDIPPSRVLLDRLLEGVTNEDCIVTRFREEYVNFAKRSQARMRLPLMSM